MADTPTVRERVKLFCPRRLPEARIRVSGSAMRGLATCALGLTWRALSGGGKAAEPQEGIFHYNGEIPRFFGETAEAHPPCGTSMCELVSRVDTAMAWDEAQERSTQAQRGRRAMGNTLERRHKLRRESADSSGFNHSGGRNGFAVGARPWRRLYAMTRTSVCGDERLVSLITMGYVGVTPGGYSRGDEPRDLTARENPCRAKPQGRYRHEIRPEARARRKPSRGCETLRAERTR